MALAYSNNETRNGNSFPRTYYDPTTNKILVSNSGSATNASFSSPNGSQAVGTNNVCASFYLIMKNADMSPDVFLCPSTTNQRPFGPGSTSGVQDCSNWPDIVNNLSYSYAAPFPTTTAAQGGWKWNSDIGFRRPHGLGQESGQCFPHG